MIHYLAVDGKPLRTFLESAGAPLRDRLSALSYRELERQRRDGALRPGAYVFTDFERLSGSELRAATGAWEELSRLPGVQLFNDPRHTLRRYELLRTLHEQGVNRFTAHRAFRIPRDARFPVFLRTEHEHQGNASGLLRTRGAVLRAILDYARRRPRLTRWVRHLIAVEHLDVADAAGVYRKYSCFAIGDVVVPRHLFLARGWMVKHAGLLDARAIAEECAFLESNPHQAELRAAFRAGRVDFGRADYAVVGGRVQVWEINTNAMITTTEDSVPLRAHALAAFSARFLPLLSALDEPTNG